MITVVGLGFEEGDLTEKGKQAILSAAAEGKKIAARTAETASYKNLEKLGVAHESFDYIYKNSRNFSTLNRNLAKAAAELGEGGVYCVDGAASEDNSVKQLLKSLRGKVKVIDGVSKVSVLAERARFVGCSYTAVSAYEIGEAYAEGRLHAPLLVFDMDDRALASDVKLILSDLFDDEAEAKYLCADEKNGGVQAKKIHVFELDRQKKYTSSSAVAIERTDLFEKKKFDLADLKELVVRLRRPDGCPWDKVQTPESIKMNVVEEAYELVDAIESGEREKILEETGDILLQAVFHAVMQEERGEFDLTDAVTGICRKLIGRHTHIFGKDKANDENGALNVWEKNKMIEKHQETYAAAVNDVPKCFPALLQAQKIVKRTEKGGWKVEPDYIMLKFVGILGQLKDTADKGEKTDGVAFTEKAGEALMCMAWLYKKWGVDCEEVLLDETKKIKRLYTAYEEAVRADGKDVNALTEEEKYAYYLRAKES